MKSPRQRNVHIYRVENPRQLVILLVFFAILALGIVGAIIQSKSLRQKTAEGAGSTTQPNGQGRP